VTEAENDVAEAEALVRRCPVDLPLGLGFSFRAHAGEASDDAWPPAGLQIRRMDLEARSLPVSVKTPLLNKLRDYKARRGAPGALKGTVPRRAALSRLRADKPGDAEGQRQEGWRRADGH
jgi:hypothetical protein